MPIVKQLVVTLDNRPGALAVLCSELAKVALNIYAIQASETGPISPVRLVVSDLAVARRVCEALGLKCVEQPALSVVLGQRPGALGRVLRKLAAKGINVDYLYCTSDKSIPRAIAVLGVSDLAAGAKVAG